MKLDGIHHITAITGDAQRNVDFYAGDARAADGQEDRQPGRAERLPPLLRGRAGRPGRRHDLLRVPRRPARPGRRRDDPPDRLAGRLGRGARLLGRAAGRRPGSSPSATGDSLVFADPEGLEHALVVADGPRPAADRRPSRGPRRVGAPGLRPRARLQRRARAQRRPARAASSSSPPTTAGRRAAMRAAASGPTTRRRPSAGSRAPGTVHHIAWASESTSTSTGASARSPAARTRPRSSTGSGSGRSTSASRAGCCSSSRPSARASASTRTPSTSARS